jgi:hypothetical protein
LGQLKGYVGGMVGLSSAISLVKGTFSAMKQESDAAVASLRTLVDTRRDLIQIARDSRDFDELQTRADRGAAWFGVDRQVAGKVLATTRREGFEGDYERLLRANRVLDVEAAAPAGGKINSAFGGRISEYDAIELMFSTQKRSDKSFEEVAKFMPQMAEGAGLTGASPEETFAIGSVLMDRMARGKTAAGLGRSFALQMQSDPKLRGKGYLEAVRTVEEEFTPEEQKPYLQSKETVEFFDIVKEERQRIRALEQDLRQQRTTFGTPRSEMEQAIRLAEADPRTSAEQKMRSAEIAEEISRERELAVGGANQEAARHSIRTAYREGGANQLDTVVVGFVADRLRNIGVSEENMRRVVAMNMGFGTSGFHNPKFEEARAMTEASENLVRASGRLDQAAGNIQQQSGSYTNRARREQSMPAE